MYIYENAFKNQENIQYITPLLTENIEMLAGFYQIGHEFKEDTENGVPPPPSSDRKSGPFTIDV